MLFKKSFIVFLFSIVMAVAVSAQTDSALRQRGVIKAKVKDTLLNKKRTDTLLFVKKDTARQVATPKKPVPFSPPAVDRITDTNFAKVVSDTIAAIDTLAAMVKPANRYTRTDSLYKVFLNNPFLPIAKKPVYQIAKVKINESKDELFYLAVALVIYLGMVKLIFSRYFSNLFAIFFQPTFRQKQTREQLTQSNLPSLLLNLFFIFTGATYLSLVIKYYQLLTISFWELLLYATLCLGLLYSIKYIFLSFSGWVFNAKEAVSTYMFVVFLINKMLGIVLVPFILIIAFSKPGLINISLTISLVVVSVLFAYRYIVSYVPVTREVKVNPFHFSLYILAIELLPLLVIYKTLILYLDRTL